MTAAATTQGFQGEKCDASPSPLLIWQSHLIVPWVFEAGYGHFALHSRPAIPAVCDPGLTVFRNCSHTHSCALWRMCPYVRRSTISLFSGSSAASLLTVYMHGRVRTASRTTFEASSVTSFPRYAVATASAYALQAIPTCDGTHTKTTASSCDL